MKVITSVVIGIASGVAAVFLHLFFPPYGLALACVGTFTAIWAVGRKFGKRRFKLIAALAWLAIFLRAASFGTGREIFIQGDSLGNNFLIISFIAITLAIAFPAN